MSLNQSLNISLESLKNNQYAMTVVSQNIANLNTEGYVRQDVAFQTNRYTTECSNVINTIKGMNGASISALRDFFDDSAFKDLVNTNADANYYNTLADSINGLEDVMDALGDDGLNALLNDFYAAAANLEQYPDDISIRQQYVLCAQNVCDKFNEVSKSLNSKESELYENIEDEVNIVNNLAQKLAQANESYLKSGKSPVAQSEIQGILEELSNYIDFTTQNETNGTVTLYIGGQKVVQNGHLNYTLTTNIDPTAADNKVTLALQSTKDENIKIVDGVNEKIQSGSLGARVAFANGSENNYFNISDIQDKLNQAANAFATQLNDIQKYNETYTDANGTQHHVFAAYLTTENGKTILSNDDVQDFFISQDGGAIDASNISINDAIVKNPFLVCAARVDSANYQGDEWKLAVGNSDNATKISDLQNQKICSYINANDTTMSKFLTNLAAKIGTDTSGVQSKANMFQNIADSAATTYSNLTGVNLDEELASMLKYQRSYEASAKVFSAVNDMFTIILNLV